MTDRVGGASVSNVNTTYNQEVQNKAKVDNSALPPELQNAKKSGSKLGLALKISATILTGGLFGIGWGIYSLVKSCKKSGAQAANQPVQQHQADNSRVQENNVNQVHEQPKVEANPVKESFESVKCYDQQVRTSRVQDVVDMNYLNRFKSNNLKDAVKTIVEDAFKRNPDAVTNLIRQTFSVLLNIDEQQLKNALACCVFGNRDREHNVFSCNLNSEQEFIASIKTLFEYHVPAAPEAPAEPEVQEFPQDENNVEANQH